MALIHEGIGRVAYDPAGAFAPGAPVVMLPNDPVEEDEVIAENYLRSSRFCGSGFDGFMQELCILPRHRVMCLPDGIDLNVAAFTELVSVAVHAVSRFESIAHRRRSCVGVWGDGNVGFIVSLVLRMLYPDMKICVFGRNTYKLADFSFADKTYLTSGIPDDLRVDHAFECCGGEGAEHAIEQIIDYIQPEGAISLMGVTENPVPINTRMVLEKGLRLFGSSRSGRADFERTLQLYRDNPHMLEYLSALAGTVIPIHDIRDIASAFDADMRKQMGKTIMKWEM
jgi:ribitol-5-phosphate 2-dehydrogenase